jgi:hypothetical protein
LAAGEIRSLDLQAVTSPQMAANFQLIITLIRRAGDRPAAYRSGKKVTPTRREQLLKEKKGHP